LSIKYVRERIDGRLNDLFISKKPYDYFSFIFSKRGFGMHVRKISIPVLSSFLIIMFMMFTGCGKMQATSVVSGTVTGENVDGITINMTGGETKSVTTDADGKFSFNNQDNGYFTIKPYHEGYSFYPASKDVAVSGVSVAGIDFSSTWVGYSISGTVTGVVQKDVTLTLFKSSPFTWLGSTTADSDGKYTLTNTNVINDTFDIIPSLAGYRFTPKTTQVTVSTASVTEINFVSKTTHANGSAKGTYTWDSMTGALNITWTSGTFPCNWPQLGLQSESHVTISKAIMTWPDAVTWPGVMVWTRTSATENNPVGEWTATDQTGNTYTATFTATDSTTGSISMDNKIIACAYAWANADAQNWSAGDHTVWLSYQDPDKAATPVSVEGTWITDPNPKPLTYNDSHKAWETTVDLGSSPAPPYTYTFTVTDPEGTWEEASCFVEWATGLYTEWTDSTKTLTFHWTKTSDGGGSYIVLLQDGLHNPMWQSVKTTDTHIDYNGATGFTTGTYYYYVLVVGTGNCSNGRSLSDEGSFSCSKTSSLVCAD
jgi:hypothetical protein